MERLTMIWHSLAAARTEPRREAQRGLAAGLATLVPIVLADVLLGGTAVFVAAYPLGPIVAAVFAMAPTLLLWAVTLALGALSFLWNHNGGRVDYWLRLAELVAAGAFAVFLAYRRTRTERVSDRLALLDEIGATADGSLPLDETLRRALEGIVPGAADFCLIDTVRDEAVIRVAVRARGRSDWRELEDSLRRRKPSTPSWLRRPEFGIPPVPYFLPRVTRGHEEILSHDDEDLRFLRSLGLQSVVIAPMIARGRLLGTLTLAVAWSARRYGPDDLAFARALASRLGLALDHAGLFSDLESVERRMDAVMSKIPQAVTVHDAQGSLVFANDVAAEWLGLRTGSEVMAADAAALRERIEIYAEDGTPLDDEELISARLLSGRLPFRRLVRVVTRFDGRDRWVVANADVIRGADEEILYAVTTLEDVTDTKRAEMGQRLLARTGELLMATRDYRATLQRVAELAVPGFADWCSVNLLAEDGLIEQAAVANVDPSRRELAVRLRDRHPVRIEDGSRLATVIAEEASMRFEVTDEELRGLAVDVEHLALMRGTGLGSAIAVPIRAGERIVGALSFVNAPERHPFEDSDVTLAAEIGARAGIAIENARLTEMRTEIADSLQHGLLPPALPTIPGWEVASLYRPAGELNEVGGDFYDAFEVENGWMVVVGDVVGRGARAAALTAMARHTIYTACALSGDPRQALSILNERLRQRSDPPLCSVAIVVLSAADTGAADAIAVSAGHPLPLIIRGQTVEEACQPGPLLGTIAEPEWQLSLVELEPGEQLIVYTDGITDARAWGETFGEQRLREHLAGASDPPASCARIELALAAFAGGPIADDATAVAVMRARDNSGAVAAARSGGQRAEA